MSLLTLAPWAAVAGALGVCALLTASPRGLRIAGALLVAGSAAPLALLRLPALPALAAERPALAAAGALAGAAVVAGGAAVALRLPWLVPVAALVTGLRVPMSPTPSPTDHFVPFWIVILSGLAAVVYATARGRQGPARLGPLGPVLGLYVLLVAASLFWSSDREAGAYALVAFYLPLGALVAMIGMQAVGRPLPAALAGTQVALALVFAGVALFQLHEAQLFWNPDLIAGNDRLPYFRANSLFWDLSALGRFEGLAIVTVLGLLALDPVRRSVVGGAAVCAVVFAGLWLSYSRTSLGMVAVCVVLVALAWRPRAALVTLGVLVLASAAALPVLAGELDVSWDRITSGRATILGEGLAEFSAHPVAGVGAGGFGFAHSVVLGVGAELGVLGLVAFAALVLTVGRAALRPADPAAWPVLRVLVAVELAGITLHSLLDAGLFDDPMAWALAGLLARLAQPDAGVSPRPRSSA